MEFAGDLEEATVRGHGAFDWRPEMHDVAEAQQLGVTRGGGEDSDHAQTTQDGGRDRRMFAAILVAGQQRFRQGGVFGG